jgi:GT2 family glycosyltransferase
LSPTDSYSQHVVTAVIVAHDGAAWLPRLLDALNEQTRPVQRVVAVDTGSRDRSGSVLAAQLGQAAVFGMDRSTGYAAAVRRALQHKAANAAVAAGAGGMASRGRDDQIEWLWLLHDDCEPAADALEQLLRGAAETPTAAVLGPKLMDWTDRDVIVEAGLTIDTAGRRITGIEPREVDQGQHDGDRDSLAVSSAGMLVRRDVWEQAGGFDPGMTLFGEDIDFCWRVHGAGFRVRVITDAVLFHVAAAARGRRLISVGRRARLLERRNGILALLGNLPAGPMLAALLGNLALSLLRTVFYLVAKRPTAALDESAAVLGVVGHPIRLAKARRLRARGRRAAYAALRADMPPGRSVRRAAEFAASVLSRSSPQDLAGAHHATDDPTEDDSLLTDSGVLQRVLTRPGVLLLIGLIAITIAAERSLITSGTIGGGALLPAWEGASSLWGQFLQAYHPAGIGSASSGPPYVGIVALLATILLGKSWLAVDVLLLGCVPLAGVTAFLALRRVTGSVAVRVWAAASYALLPVAFGAISAGRLGSAVAFVLIPAIGMLAGRMLSMPPKLARRAAWATGLAVTVGAAFVPLLWPMAVVGAVVAGIARWRSVPALLQNIAIVVVTPPVLLLPWFIGVLSHPSQLLLEAGLPQPGLAEANLPAKSLLLLSPGGPGLPPYWVSGALVLTGLAALLASRRRMLIVSGWVAALLGFATALLVSRASVTLPGGPPVTPWPGVALAVGAAGLLLAAAAAADALRRAPSASGRPQARRLTTARRLPVAILALVACTAPVLAAAYWLMNGVSGPIGPASGQIVPSLVAATAGAGRQLRTLVLGTSGPHGRASFLLLRGDSPPFSYPDVSQAPSAETALSKAVAALVAPGGGEAVDQSQQLARFDIGFVLMRAPINGSLASVLDNVSGLTEVSLTSTFDLWRLSTPPSRVSVLEPSGVVAPVESGAVNVAGAPVPTSGGTVLLAEPAGGWSAALNGHALTPVRSPAGSWAQAFRLPSGGGTLTISRNALLHNLVMAVELLAFVVVAALALPGIRSVAEMEAAAAAAAAGAGRPDADAEADASAEADSLAGRRRQAGESTRARDSGREAGAGEGRSRGGRRRSGFARPTRAAGKSAGRRAAAIAGSGASGAAGAAVAGGVSAASAGGAGRGRGADIPAAARGQSRPGAAWPAGQPVSRFIGGPPDGQARTAQPGLSGGGVQPGMPYESPPRSPSGSGYPAAPEYPASDYDDLGASGGRYATRPGYGSGGGYPAGESQAVGSGYSDLAEYGASSGYDDVRSYRRTRDHADGPGYSGGSGYSAERGYSGPAGYEGTADYQSGGGYPGRSDPGDRRYAQPPSGGSSAGQQRGGPQGYQSPGSWPEDDQQRDWPESGQQRGSWAQDYQSPGSWPTDDQQRGWPQDYRTPRSSAGAARQEPWAEQGEALEALPPEADEVHHDWPARDDRTARGWAAPSEDGEGEAW